MKESIRKKLIMFGLFVCGFLAGILFVCMVRADTSQDQLQLIQSLAQQNAEQHTWTYGKFMCADFVAQLSVLLYDNHIKMNLRSGRYYNLNNNTSCSEFNRRHFKCRHYWLEAVLSDGTIVPIETTRGYVIPADIYKAYYK